MPQVVSPQDWETARQALLVKEKELTRARDALAADRRRMPQIVSPQDWEAARQALLVKEKDLTRARDALAAARRRMPRMAVREDYRFDGPKRPREPASAAR